MNQSIFETFDLIRSLRWQSGKTESRVLTSVRKQRIEYIHHASDVGHLCRRKAFCSFFSSRTFCSYDHCECVFKLRTVRHGTHKGCDWIRINALQPFLWVVNCVRQTHSYSSAFMFTFRINRKTAVEWGRRLFDLLLMRDRIHNSLTDARITLNFELRYLFAGEYHLHAAKLRDARSVSIYFLFQSWIQVHNLHRTSYFIQSHGDKWGPIWSPMFTFQNLLNLELEIPCSI